MEKLSEIQRQLKAPKGQFNKFGNYNYRSCEDILEAVKPLLNGCQLTISDRIVQIGDRYYIEATAMLSDGDKSVSTTAYAREQESKKGMDASQITGSASSYARKYALNGLFLIDDTKDADTMDNTKREVSKDTKPEGKQSESDSKEMSKKQWDFIKSIGEKEHELTENEVVQMVKWVAEKEGISPRHWKISKLLLPAENFEKVLTEFCEFKMDENAGDDINF